jgi:hypothetical protein
MRRELGGSSEGRRDRRSQPPFHVSCWSGGDNHSAATRRRPERGSRHLPHEARLSGDRRRLGDRRGRAATHASYSASADGGRSLRTPLAGASRRSRRGHRGLRPETALARLSLSSSHAVPFQTGPPDACAGSTRGRGLPAHGRRGSARAFRRGWQCARALRRALRARPGWLAPR